MLFRSAPRTLRLLALASAAAFPSFALPLAAQEAPALVNVATRGQVGTDADVMIAGVVVTGTAPRTLLFRVQGPSLTPLEVDGALVDPEIVITALTTGEEIARNDNWRNNAAADLALAQERGFTPKDDRECLVVRSVAPGGYTATVSGKNRTTGVALVEVFDLDTQASTAPSFSRVLNLSTRANVGSGSAVLITGFIIKGTAPRNILINGIAGSLSEFGLGAALPDSAITVVKIEDDGTQTPVAESDDWITSPDFDVIARSGSGPRDPLEAAVYLRNLAPGTYTAILRGVDGSQGVALPELYELRTEGTARFSLPTLAGRKGNLVYSTGTAGQTVAVSFAANGVAVVGTGAAGTYTYTVKDDFRADVSVTASGYTVTGTLQFYRGNMAVFEGKLQAPGTANQDAGGILVLEP
jgi:hypothetical protein